MGCTFDSSFSIGIGDLCLIKAQLDAQKHHYERIRISPSWGLLRYRSEQYRTFVDQFFRLLFDGQHPYVIDYAANLPQHDVHTLRACDFPAQHPRLASLLCAGKSPPLPRPYLVLQTKVRDFSQERWHASKGPILEALRGLGDRYDLVLLGERIVEPNEEYAYHGEQLIYSIYPDLQQLPVLDRTFERLGVTPPDLQKLRQDCEVMRSAKCCVTIGLGGALCLALSVGRVLGLRGDVHPTLDILYRDATQPGVVLTHDTGMFLQRLRQL